MDAHLRAGIAIYNAGGYHAAHDAWEEHWLGLASGTDDEQFLHGLIQFTAAVYHARNGNWSGTTGLADSAREYLAGLPSTYRRVDLSAVRDALDTFAADPEVVERRPPPPLRYEGRRLHLADLGFAATAVAAEVLAEEHGYDEAVFERAAEFARADLDAERTGSEFLTLLFDFVREPEHRPIVAQRLADHVARRASEDEDVAGLFEKRD